MPPAIAIRKVEGKPGSVYYPLETIDVPTPTPGPNDVVIRLAAAALNHRDLFIRQHLYPAIGFGVPLLADGAGVVIAAGTNPAAQAWLGARVVVNPGSGWADALDGPESPTGYAIMGGTKTNPRGTLAELMCIDAGEVEAAPAGLSDAEAAALPLAGLTAWRATVVKTGNAVPGRNILVTGIGGGVAIMALLFAAAAGCRVYVTSSSEEKLARAKELGAAGGVNYKDKDWDKKLLAMLPSDRKYLDAIVDGAGGDVVFRGMKMLKVGSQLLALLKEVSLMSR